MFKPRGQTQKRTEIIPQVRLTADERQALERLREQLSQRDGVEYGLADTVRIALGDLYQRLFPETGP